MWDFQPSLGFHSHDRRTVFAEGKVGSSLRVWQNKDAPFTKGDSTPCCAQCACAGTGSKSLAARIAALPRICSRRLVSCLSYPERMCLSPCPFGLNGRTRASVRRRIPRLLCALQGRCSLRMNIQIRFCDARPRQEHPSEEGCPKDVPKENTMPKRLLRALPVS